MVDRILALISEKGMSVSAVEKQLKFGNGAIKRFDINSPSIDKVIALSNFLNVSIDFLVFGKTAIEINGTDNSYIKVVNVREREAIRMFHELPENEQLKLIGRMELLIEQYQNDNFEEAGG